MRRPDRKLRVVAPALAALLATSACTDPPRQADTRDSSAVEPDVFDVIRASNSKQAVERLRDRYHEEVEHAKLLEARIGEAIAAEEALSAEQRQRLESLQKIRDEVRVLVDQNATLEKQLAAEITRRDELRKKIDQAQADAAAAAAGKPADGKPADPKSDGKAPEQKSADKKDGG